MAKPELKTRPDLADDQTWIVWTAAQPENRGIDVHGLYRKMLEWCLKKGVTPTRRRLLNWLDTEREAMPMTYEPAYFVGTAGGSAAAPISEEEPPLPDCSTCKNERFVSQVINPDAEFDWAKTQMVPCPDCNTKA